jgi:hypothetical protein
MLYYFLSKKMLEHSAFAIYPNIYYRTDGNKPHAGIALRAVFTLQAYKPVEHAKRAKQKTTRYAGARQL